MSIGFTLPFAKTTGSIGYFDTTQDEYAAVTQNIRSLLITNWGERPMHYNFGCNFSEFLFEQDSSSDFKSRIADRILSQMSTWLPFVIVVNLNVISPLDDSSLPENSLKIAIKFKLLSRPDIAKSVDYTITP